MLILNTIYQSVCKMMALSLILLLLRKTNQYLQQFYQETYTMVCYKNTILAEIIDGDLFYTKLTTNHVCLAAFSPRLERYIQWRAYLLLCTCLLMFPQRVPAKWRHRQSITCRRSLDVYVLTMNVSRLLIYEVSYMSRLIFVDSCCG